RYDNIRVGQNSRGSRGIRGTQGSWGISAPRAPTDSPSPSPSANPVGGSRNMPDDSSFSLKRLLVGQPIPSSMARHERLSRVTGLAVLSSDALSSVAYATDFILATLVVAGVSAFTYAIPISLVS